MCKLCSSGAAGTAKVLASGQCPDPTLGRFVSADTIVPEPGNPQSLNRYAYVKNNPLKYTDSSGHWFETALDIAGIAYDIYEIKRDGLNWVNGAALAVDVVCFAAPIATGGGMAVRAAAHADEAVDVVVHADEVVKGVGYVDEAVSGLHQPLQDAITAAAKETGSTIAVRGRPRGAHFFDGIFPFKPQGAETLEDLGQGLRTLKGKDGIYVSDLDIGWVEQGGQILPNEMVYKRGATGVGNLINENYGMEIVQHGPQSAYRGRYDTWFDDVFIFGSNGYKGSGLLRKTWMMAEGTLEYLP